MPTEIEAPLTIVEVAAGLKVTRNTATKLFESEPGVIIIDRPQELHKRKYRTIRVPRHVFERVVRRLTVRP